MGFKLKGRFIFFATGNEHKFNEARMVLAEYDIAVGMIRVKSLEIQSDSLEKIAETSAVDAFGRFGLPVFVEDAGLFVDALNGFPGPYAAYVYKTIGNKGLLQLLEKAKDRKAKFQSVIAYCSREKARSLCFEGEALGEITAEKRRGKGKSGFGFDPVFRPAGSGKTFAEMSLDEKNCFSHRAMALRRFAEWYKKPS
jgi:XTP/dITP diphosphohydrolase